MDDFATFVLVGLGLLLFFCIGLPTILACWLALRAMRMEKG